MIDPLRRRTKLGKDPSAALPIMWKELDRRGWSDAKLADEMKENTSAVSRLLYGDRKANRQQAKALLDLLGVPLDAWDKPTRATERRHKTRTRAPEDSTTSVSDDVARSA